MNKKTVSIRQARQLHVNWAEIVLANKQGQAIPLKNVRNFSIKKYWSLIFELDENFIKTHSLYLQVSDKNGQSDKLFKKLKLNFKKISFFKLLENFIEEYFDQNPISQLGLVVTRNKRAEKLAELGGNPRRHIDTVQKAAEISCTGEPSLQNSLELCMRTLRYSAIFLG